MGTKVKTYINLQDLFDDGIFTPTELIIFWGKRGSGKSSLMGKFMSEFMKPAIAEERRALSQIKCDKLRQADIMVSPPDDHIVFCDTFFEDNGFQGNQRRPYEISGLNCGLPNEIHKEIIPPIPYASIFLDEIQDLYDSHSGSLSTFVSKYFELSRQAGLFIGLACQRPIRVVKDIRDLATFVEVVNMEHMYIRGQITRTIWTVNIIYYNADLERYIDTRDKSLIARTIKIVFIGNIFTCYDTDFFLPMFYKGFENQVFIPFKVQRTEFSKEGFERYNANRIVDIPDTFRGKKPKDTKSKGEKEDGRKGTSRTGKAQDE